MFSNLSNANFYHRAEFILSSAKALNSDKSHNCVVWYGVNWSFGYKGYHQTELYQVPATRLEAVHPPVFSLHHSVPNFHNIEEKGAFKLHCGKPKKKMLMTSIFALPIFYFFLTF